MNESTNTIPEVTEETISKAYAILGIAKEDTVEKAEVETTVEEDVVEKAITELSPEELVTKKEELQKSIDAIDALEKGMKKSDDDDKKESKEDDDEKEDTVEKAVVTETIEKSEGNDDVLVKALTEVIQNEVAGVNQATSEKFKAVGELFKGFVDSQNEFSERIQKMEGRSQGRRSVTTQRQHVIEKSFASDENGLEEGQRAVSVSGNKAMIAKALTDAWEAEGRTDNQLQKSILTLDTTGKANKTIIAKAKEIGMTLIP